jgi:hypothetical protein
MTAKLITLYRVGTKRPPDATVCTNWFATLAAAKEWATEAQIEGATVLSVDPIEIKPTAVGIASFLASPNLSAGDPVTVVDRGNFFADKAKRMRAKLAAQGIKVLPFKDTR